jgi:hypothetical protein
VYLAATIRARISLKGYQQVGRRELLQGGALQPRAEGCVVTSVVTTEGRACCSTPAPKEERKSLEMNATGSQMPKNYGTLL